MINDQSISLLPVQKVVMLAVVMVSLSVVWKDVWMAVSMDIAMAGSWDLRYSPEPVHMKPQVSKTASAFDVYLIYVHGVIMDVDGSKCCGRSWK